MLVLPDDRGVHGGLYDSFGAIYLLTKDGALEGSVKYAYPGAFFRIVASPDGKRVAATTESLVQTTDAGVLDAGQGLGAVVVTLDVAK